MNFAEGICWTRTAERQASRMRMEYLKSVLRQEVGFFDNQDASSTTFQVVSTISSDAHLIQDAMAEKVLSKFLIHPSHCINCRINKFNINLIHFSCRYPTAWPSSQHSYLAL